MRAIFLGFLLVVLMLVCAPAQADLVLKNADNGSTLRLQDTPCTHGETLGRLKEEVRSRFKNARIVDAHGRIEFFGCWVQHDEDTAFVLLQDGAAMDFKLAAFSDPMI